MGAQYSPPMPHLFGTTWEWPSSCAICGRWPATVVCQACIHRHGLPRPRCPGCALPLAPGLTRCETCTKRSDQPLVGCVARFGYQYPWSDVVARFKFQNEPGWARPMARLMQSDPAVHAVLSACDLWTPIPLGATRLRQRGYNQAWELTKALHKSHPHRRGVEHQPDVLVHADHTRLQHTLPKDERGSNAALAFLINPQWRTRLAGRQVLLVDDVMTTGNTLEAAALCLLAQGAQSVRGLVFARTPATPGY